MKKTDAFLESVDEIVRTMPFDDTEPLPEEEIEDDEIEDDEIYDECICGYDAPLFSDCPACIDKMRKEGRMSDIHGWL